METEDDGCHCDIDGCEEGKAPLHDVEFGQGFERKADYNKEHQVEAGQSCKGSIPIEPECAGNIDDKDEDGDSDGGLSADFGFGQGKQEDHIHDG